MLICHKYNFLFIHIAKTGGTSVRTTLEKFRRKDPIYIAQFICSRISHLLDHKIACKVPRHAKVIAAYEMLPREVFDRLYKFAFVRNPWDLQVSSYFHLKRERPHLLEAHPEFDDFLKFKLDPGRAYQFHLDTSIDIQTEYLIDLNGKVIVDFIGRYENLNEDFESVCNHLNLPLPKLAHKRRAKNRRKDYREYYNDETAELVANFFKRDIDMFGYSFDDAAKK